MEKKSDKFYRNYTIEDLEDMLDKLAYQIWLKDKSGKYIYINKLGAEKMGLPKDRIIGKSDYEFRSREIAEECARTDRSLVDKEVDIYNEEHININGQDIWYKVNKFALKRDSEEDTIIGGAAEEISLQKRAQLELESNLTKYLDQNKTEEDSKIMLYSIIKSLKKTIGCNNIEILLYIENEKKFSLYLSEDKENSRFKENFEILINEEIEKKLCSNDFYEDKYFDLYDKITKSQKDNINDKFKIKHIKLANKLFGIVCISYDNNMNFLDIDDSTLDEILGIVSVIIKQIENKSKIMSIKDKKEALESIVQLECIKANFFANISHEFRTPINVILSAIQLLISCNEDNNIYIDNKKYLNILKQNAYRLLRLVDNSIDTAKISNNIYDLKLENHNIISIVENIIMLSVKSVQEKKRNIIFDTDEEEVILACDVDKIEKVILNLISNAVKFSTYNSDIEVKIKTDIDEKKIFISVKNYGDAIKENNREKVFGKCIQIDDLFNRKAEGSGMGLFLARKFVEMHKGKIYIDNIENATQFTFYLPICTVDGEYVYDRMINENEIIERCNIEFSDIYT